MVNAALSLGAMPLASTAHDWYTKQMDADGVVFPHGQSLFVAFTHIVAMLLLRAALLSPRTPRGSHCPYDHVFAILISLMTAIPSAIRAGIRS